MNSSFRHNLKVFLNTFSWFLSAIGISFILFSSLFIIADLTLVVKHTLINFPKLISNDTFNITKITANHGVTVNNILLMSVILSVGVSFKLLSLLVIYKVLTNISDSDRNDRVIVTKIDHQVIDSDINGNDTDINGNDTDINDTDTDMCVTDTEVDDIAVTNDNDNESRIADDISTYTEEEILE